MENIYIYKITNKKDNSIYIGIRRIEGDIYQDKYKGEDTILRKELRKQGKKTFSTEILAKDLTEDLAKTLILEYKKILKATILEDILEKDKLRKASQKGKSSGRKRKVICLNNEKEFDSTADASACYGLKRTSVAKACSKGVFAGIDIETGEKLKWMYYDEYLALKEGKEDTTSNEDIIIDDNVVKPEVISNTNEVKTCDLTKILCKTTGKTFNSTEEASEFYGVAEGAIERCCLGRRSFAGLDPKTGEKLTWEYAG